MNLKDLRALQADCKQHDAFTTPIYWESFQQPRPNVLDHCYYVDDKLIAYAGLFTFVDNSHEICALVHPAHRRKGFFTESFAKLHALAKQHDIKQINFICPQGLLASEKTLAAIGAQYQSSEYILTRSLTKTSDINPKQTIQLVKAKPEDCDTLVALDVASFQSNKHIMQHRFTQTLTDPHRITWLAKQDGNSIGKIHARFENNQAILHDLCITPAKQQQGYGSAMLQHALLALAKLGIPQVTLGVYATNENALTLYQHAGFTQQQCDDTYRYDIHQTLG